MSEYINLINEICLFSLKSNEKLDKEINYMNHVIEKFNTSQREVNCSSNNISQREASSPKVNTFQREASSPKVNTFQREASSPLVNTSLCQNIMYISKKKHNFDITYLPKNTQKLYKKVIEKHNAINRIYEIYENMDIYILKSDLMTLNEEVINIINEFDLRENKEIIEISKNIAVKTILSNL